MKNISRKKEQTGLRFGSFPKKANFYGIQAKEVLYAGLYWSIIRHSLR